MAKAKKRVRKSDRVGAVESEAADVGTPVRNLCELTAVVNSRVTRIAFAPEFSGWEDEAGERKTKEHYVFVPRADGVFQCEQIRHPDSSILTGGDFASLCRLILGGSEAVFELDPSQQSAVRFCERLLATLWAEAGALAHAHSPFAEGLMRRSDWAARDGIGPATLPVPIVAGYTAAANMTCLAVTRPAVIWSCRWQLAVDPVDEVVALVRDRVARHVSDGVLTVDPSSVRTPATDTAGISEALAPQLVDCGGALTRAEFNEHVRHVIGTVMPLFRVTAGDVDGLVGKLLTILHENRQGMQERLMMCLRAPEKSVYLESANSFPGGACKGKDCWGHPVAFVRSFGKGRVTVLPRDGGALLKSPASDVPEAEFVASEGFTNITWRGQQYVLNGRASTVIEALSGAQEKGLRGLHQREIASVVYSDDRGGGDPVTPRAQNLFRRGDAKRLWDQKFLQHDGKGNFWLTAKIHTPTQ